MRNVLLLVMIGIFLSTVLYSAELKTRAVLVVMPEGDAAAGREAFVKLSCNSCHGVINDPLMPEAKKKDRGPDLGGVETRWTSGYQATSIVSPSHLIAYEYINKSKDHSSPMPDLTEKMTVKQLIDLLTYLQPLEKK